MKLGIRAKLVLISLGILVPAFVLGYAYLRHEIEDQFGLPSSDVAVAVARLDSVAQVAALVGFVVALVMSTVAAAIASRTARALAIGGSKNGRRRSGDPRRPLRRRRIR